MEHTPLLYHIQSTRQNQALLHLIHWTTRQRQSNRCYQIPDTGVTMELQSLKRTLHMISTRTLKGYTSESLDLTLRYLVTEATLDITQYHHIPMQFWYTLF